MKVSVQVKEFRGALALCEKSVAARATLPVLSNFKLEAEASGGLLVQSCNLEISTSRWTGAKVDEVGAITVPARTMLDLIGAMPDEIATLSTNDRTHTLNVKCGRFENNVRGIEAGEFPLVPTDFSGWSSVKGEAGDWANWLKRGMYAAATDESRPILEGTLLSLDGNLTMASSDGFRLAVQTAKLADVPNPVRIIVPAKALSLALNILSLAVDVYNDPGKVTVSVSPEKNKVAFAVDGAQVLAQLIDGNFPDYNAIIPKSSKTTAVIGTAELVRALKVANVFSRESSNIVKFEFAPPASEFVSGTINVSAVSAETGDGMSQMDATVTGEPLTIALNCKYILDALDHLGTAQAELSMRDAASPVLVKPVGDDSHQAVVMPMNLSK